MLSNRPLAWRPGAVVVAAGALALAAYVGLRRWSSATVASADGSAPATLADLVAHLSPDEKKLLVKFPPGPRQEFMAYSLYHDSRPARTAAECAPFVHEVQVCLPRPSEKELSDPAVADQFGQAGLSLLNMVAAWTSFGPFEGAESDWADDAARLADHPDLQVRIGAAAMLMAIEDLHTGPGLSEAQKSALNSLERTGLVKQRAVYYLRLCETEGAPAGK